MQVYHPATYILVLLKETRYYGRQKNLGIASEISADTELQLFICNNQGWKQTPFKNAIWDLQEADFCPQIPQNHIGQTALIIKQSSSHSIRNVNICNFSNFSKVRQLGLQERCKDVNICSWEKNSSQLCLNTRSTVVTAVWNVWAASFMTWFF